MSTEKSKKNPAPAKTEPAAEVVKVAEPVAPVIEYVTSTDLAQKLGTKPTILRRWLRTLPRFQDSGYTRYKWEKDDPFLKDAEESFKKFKVSDEEKKARREKENEEKKAKKEAEKQGAEPAKKGKKKAEPEPEPEEAEDDDILEDEEGEELE